MQTPNERLRADRMIFYADDVQRLDRELDGFLELSGARSALLIDTEGHMITRRGEAPSESLESLAALVAGSFAATQQVAQLLGEEGFHSLAHQGQEQGIQLSAVGLRTLLAVVWDSKTNLETAENLKRVLEQLGPAADHCDAGLAQDYSEQASKALDDLF